MRYRAYLRTVMLLGAVLACQRAPSTDPGEWPQFRGRQGLGISTAAQLPVRWSENSDNVVWKTRLPGVGNSSPIVSHDRVFVTTAVSVGDTVERSVVAIDLQSGELLWRTLIESGRREKKHRYNTFAAPTPATDGELVFVHFGDTLAAVDMEGRILWTTQTDPQYLEFAHYGAASSPVLTERAVIVTQDRETTHKPAGWLAAFDKQTGEELWRQTWDDTCCSYTTPLVRRRGAGEEILLPHAGSIASYAAATGEQLWQQPLNMSQPVASAVTEGDLLAVFSGAHNVRIGAVLRLQGSGKNTEVEVLWETNQMVPQTSSPVLYNGLLFTIVEQGLMVCYDALTGAHRWRQRLPRGGGYRSSLVAGDGRIYALNSAGTTLVIAAQGEFEQLSANSLAEGGNASPAIAGESLLIRTNSALYRIRGEPTPSSV